MKKPPDGGGGDRLRWGQASIVAMAGQLGMVGS
jgi:hypothetical protein